MKRILLTTDFSEESRRSYAKTVEMAKKLGMGIRLVHVILDVTTIPHGAALAPPQSSPEISEEIAEAKDKIAEEVKNLGDGIDVQTEVRAGEHVAKTIAELAKQDEIDMIALSTHGRTGLRHFILGSVAEEILRHAPVPVLTFPAVE